MRTPIAPNARNSRSTRVSCSPPREILAHALVMLGVAGIPFASLSGLGCGPEQGRPRPGAGGGGSGNEVGAGGVTTTDANTGGIGTNAGSRDAATVGLDEAAVADDAVGGGGSPAGHLDANSADGNRSDAQTVASD